MLRVCPVPTLCGKYYLNKDDITFGGGGERQCGVVVVSDKFQQGQWV